jgi:hypothetical protein
VFLAGAGILLALFALDRVLRGIAGVGVRGRVLLALAFLTVLVVMAFALISNLRYGGG